VYSLHNDAGPLGSGPEKLWDFVDEAWEVAMADEITSSVTKECEPNAAGCAHEADMLFCFT
jgi:hypothetical protein